MSSVGLFDEAKFAQSLLALARGDTRVTSGHLFWRLDDAYNQCAESVFTAMLARVVKTICAELVTAKLNQALCDFVIAITVCVLGSPCVFQSLTSYDLPWTLEMAREILVQSQLMQPCRHSQCVEPRFLGISCMLGYAKYGVDEVPWSGASCPLSKWIQNKALHSSALKLLSNDAATLERLLHVPMLYGRIRNAEDFSLMALNVSETSLRTILPTYALETFIAQVILAHNTTIRLYIGSKIETATMLKSMVDIKPAWSALLNVIDIDTPQRWISFCTKLDSLCYLPCSHCLDNDTTGGFNCHSFAVKRFQLFEQEEANAVTRAAHIVQVITESTLVPHAIARLIASYEVDSRLSYTVRTIERGHPFIFH